MTQLFLGCIHPDPQRCKCRSACERSGLLLHLVILLNLLQLFDTYRLLDVAVQAEARLQAMGPLSGKEQVMLLSMACTLYLWVRALQLHTHADVFSGCKQVLFP